MISLILSWLKKAKNLLAELLRAIWLYFPGLLFLALSYVVIGSLTQGRDVIVQAAEHIVSGGVMVLAVTFWAYVTWYTSRMLTDEKYQQPGALYRQLPRIMGYTCFVIPQLAIVNLPVVDQGGWTWPLIIISVILYLVINRFGKSWKSGPDIWMVIIIMAISVLGSLANFMLAGDTVTFLKVLVVLFMLQAALFLYFNVTRRQRLQQLGQQKGAQNFKAGALKVKVTMTAAERRFFMLFNGISTLGLIVYLLAIFVLSFARNVSSFTIVFVAFGVLLGAGNMISFVSMRIKLNLHVVVIALAVITSVGLKDPYRVDTYPALNGNNGFAERMDLRSYTEAWIESRQELIAASERFPMIFVLADGGASRSGYWTAACLGVLQDQSERFDDHLFMLSGASGGSVGNSTYFSLLDQQSAPGSYEEQSKAFMSNDFLAFTISRMLGPDYFRHVFPINFVPIKDRAATLEYGMEHPVTGPRLFRKRISGLVTGGSRKAEMPILVINTTRMNDAKPGVISTVKLDTGFTKRLDVLGRMRVEDDMNLSTAAVMGARFPYVSPGGELVDNNYFVDGGYFDNSGAGAAHETIQAIEFYLSDSTFLADVPSDLVEKLDFYVIHLMNSPPETPVTEMDPISPLANDLAAPIITLMSSYGQQTNVNNQRLYNYLDYEKYPGTFNKEFPERHWVQVNLYDMAAKGETFSMNWVISQKDLSGMDRMVAENPNLALVKQWLNRGESRKMYGF